MVGGQNWMHQAIYLVLGLAFYYYRQKAHTIENRWSEHIWRLNRKWHVPQKIIVLTFFSGKTGRHKTEDSGRFYKVTQIYQDQHLNIKLQGWNLLPNNECGHSEAGAKVHCKLRQIFGAALSVKHCHHFSFSPYLGLWEGASAFTLVLQLSWSLRSWNCWLTLLLVPSFVHQKNRKV